MCVCGSVCVCACVHQQMNTPDGIVGSILLNCISSEVVYPLTSFIFQQNRAKVVIYVLDCKHKHKQARTHAKAGKWTASRTPSYRGTDVQTLGLTRLRICNCHHWGWAVVLLHRDNVLPFLSFAIGDILSVGHFARWTRLQGLTPEILDVPVQTSCFEIPTSTSNSSSRSLLNGHTEGPGSRKEGCGCGRRE